MMINKNNNVNTTNTKQLDKFYKAETLKMLDGMKAVVKANKVPRLSAVGLLELTANWTKVKQQAKAEEEQKIRAKGSRADRRSGKSVKLEGKVSKSKAKTKEVRSSKKIANVRKTNRR